MSPTKPPNLHDRLSAWRKEVHRAEVARRHRRDVEERFLRFSMIMLWLAGLAACSLLAWVLSGGSVLLTLITLVFPIVTWFFCGLWRWGLLLPISLLAALAVHGAFLVW
jgi:hypothetical protein